MSAFKYSTYGGTNSSEIANFMYSDNNYISKKLDNRVRGNPPPPEVNGDLDLYEIKEDQIH